MSAKASAGSREIYLKNGIFVPKLDPFGAGIADDAGHLAHSVSFRPSGPTPIIPICWLA